MAKKRGEGFMGMPQQPEIHSNTNLVQPLSRKRATTLCPPSNRACDLCGTTRKEMAGIVTELD